MNLLVIDCENVSREIVEGLFRLDKKDYHIALVIGSHQEVENYITLGMCRIVKSYNVGHNAADFVLVAYVALEASKNDYKSIKIVSDDSGFDSAVRYLCKEGFNIVRINSKTAQSLIEDATLEVNKFGVEMHRLSSIMGFIANNIKSGESSTKFKEKCNKAYGDRANAWINKLLYYGLIQIIKVNKTEQVYFSKNRLKELGSKYHRLL